MASSHLPEPFLAFPTRFADDEMRRLLTKAAMRLFDDWQLTNSERLRLLGYSPRAHNVIRRYRQGAVIQKNSDAVIRVRLLLPIHRRLTTLLGHNLAAQQDWLRDPHDQLDHQTPLATMADPDLNGLVQVHQLIRA